LDDTGHPNPAKYPGQRTLVVRVGDYAFVVPYRLVGGEAFLITVIPSRKATRAYLKPEEKS
jgi:hypothetical protein